MNTTSIKFFLAFLAFMAFKDLQAQEINKDTFQFAAGIDASFINNFLPFDNVIGDRGDFLMHIMKHRENDKFTRHAFNIDILGTFENNENDIDRDDARFNVDYKISRGKRKRVFKNGYIRYGTELHLSYFLNQRNSLDSNDQEGISFNKNLDQSMEALLGPFLGLEFRISPRLSVYTEAGFYLAATYEIDSFRSEFTPELNFTDTTIRVRDVFDLPGSIILFYYFNKTK